ncbi:MAG TPA: hypothetical protein VK674_05765 [Candidatus Limnocylindria bacterium]|nr:hypothetical protein [Candidatus Limnocylindria bacterium]
MVQNKNYKKPILIILAAVLLVSGGVFAYRAYGRDSGRDDWVDGVNYGPPTEEEKASGDKQKETTDAEEEQQNAPEPPDQNDPQKKAVTVIITDADQYDAIIEVRSFISDHYQDGTCTITIKKGSQTVTKKTPAYRDASTTICTNPLIKRSEFPSAGDWQVTVAYASKDAAGTSDAQTIKIK